MDGWIKENKITTGVIVMLVLFGGLIYLNKPAHVIINLDLQIKCASQAKNFFDYLITDLESKKTAEFSNHYNAKLNICFALIKQYIQTGTGASFSTGTQKDLYDAVEKKVYGSYSWMSQPPKKYWEVAPLWCDIYKDGDKNNHQVCTSEGEFDAFVNSFMEN